MRSNWRNLVLTSVIVATSVFTSAHAASKKSHAGKPDPEGGALSGSVVALELRHCYAGCPEIQPDARDKIPTHIVARKGYVLEHSSEDKIARWVCEFVTKEQLQGDGSRGGFAPDPELPKGMRAELADYRGSGYDRGHCAPAGDFGTQSLKDESFYLSNMTPQNSKLNQQLWREIEERTRTWVTERGSAYEITGGFFYDPKEDDPKTHRGKVTFQTIGINKVAVPTHYFKIVVAKNPGTGQMESIAFVAENRSYERPFAFATLLRSIAWIEARTGIDFMPKLPSKEKDRLEAHAAKALWN